MQDMPANMIITDDICKADVVFYYGLFDISGASDIFMLLFPSSPIVVYYSLLSVNVTNIYIICI